MIRAVLFDLDGTLLDTAADLVGSLNFLREKEGLRPVESADYRHCVSRGALGLISAGMPESNEQIFEERKSMFLEHYENNSYQLTRPFDGVEELLQTLDQRAIPWGIVTNKMEFLTFPILRKAGLIERSACVICGDTLQHSKPHPAPVSLACEILGAECSQTLMVGDDLRDIQSGRAAGTHTALAAYGYLDPELDRNAVSGSFIAETPGDVIDFIDA